jgi:hypothetical protein
MSTPVHVFGSIRANHVTLGPQNTPVASSADVSTLRENVVTLANDHVTVAQFASLEDRVDTVEEAGYQTASDVSDAIAAIDYSTTDLSVQSIKFGENTLSSSSGVLTFNGAPLQNGNAEIQISEDYVAVADFSSLEDRVEAVEGAGYQTASDVSDAIAAIDYSTTDLSVNSIKFGTMTLTQSSGYLMFNGASMQAAYSEIQMGGNPIIDCGSIAFSNGKTLRGTTTHLVYDERDVIDSANIASYGFASNSDLTALAGRVDALAAAVQNLTNRVSDLENALS